VRDWPERDYQRGPPDERNVARLDCAVVIIAPPIEGGS